MQLIDNLKDLKSVSGGYAQAIMATTGVVAVVIAAIEYDTKREEERERERQRQKEREEDREEERKRREQEERDRAALLLACSK